MLLLCRLGDSQADGGERLGTRSPSLPQTPSPSLPQTRSPSLPQTVALFFVATKLAEMRATNLFVPTPGRFVNFVYFANFDFN
jgi:hypothetical protein